MSRTVWVLGGTGRTGTAIATRLIARGIAPVLVGRSADRLQAIATPLGLASIVAAGPEAMAAAIRRERPGVVVNTIGPFVATSAAIFAACLDVGGDYLDLANDMGAVPAVLARHDDATSAGSTIVTGAGF